MKPGLKTRGKQELHMQVTMGKWICFICVEYGGWKSACQGIMTSIVNLQNIAYNVSTLFFRSFNYNHILLT
jgi:hypothetical protein